MGQAGFGQLHRGDFAGPDAVGGLLQGQRGPIAGGIGPSEAGCCRTAQTCDQEIPARGLHESLYRAPWRLVKWLFYFT